MTISLSTAIFASIVVGGMCLVGIIISLTMLAMTGRDLPAPLMSLYVLIATSFVTGLVGLLSHTLGFRNGTTNGEAQAIKSAVLGETKPPGGQ